MTHHPAQHLHRQANDEKRALTMSNNDQVISFDMTRHAFVVAVPIAEIRPDGYAVPGQPVFALNGGDERTLVLALRAIAADIENHPLTHIGTMGGK